MNKCRVLVVGAGMYTCGKGKNEYGTILPSLIEANNLGIVDEISIVTRSSDSLHHANEKCKIIKEAMRSNITIDIHQADMTDINQVDNILKKFLPDAAIISVPDHIHSKVSIPIINNRISCLVVKPMATKIQDGLEMLEALKNAGVVGQVEFHKRLDESNLILRDKFLSGELGKPLYFTIEYSQRKSIPSEYFRLWAEKSNVFNYLGVHYVDLVYFITGYKPKTVTGWGQKKYLKSLGIDTYDSIQAVIEWEKNNDSFISTHHTNWIDPEKTSAMSDQKITFIGTKGRLTCDQKNRGIQLVLDDKGINDINPYFNITLNEYNSGKMRNKGYGINSIIQFLNDVIDFNNGKISLEDIDNIRPSFRNSIISTAVIDSLNESLKSGSKCIRLKL